MTDRESALAELRELSAKARDVRELYYQKRAEDDQVAYADDKLAEFIIKHIDTLFPAAPPASADAAGLRELSQEQIDHVLERFDQTDPNLQREIVVRLISDNQQLRADYAAALAKAKRLDETVAWLKEQETAARPAEAQEERT